MRKYYDKCKPAILYDNEDELREVMKKDIPSTYLSDAFWRYDTSILWCLHEHFQNIESLLDFLRTLKGGDLLVDEIIKDANEDYYLDYSDELEVNE